MGFYGADIGELRRLAQSLTTASESLETTRGGLQSTVSGARWAGPDGDELRGRWTSELGPALAAAAATLRDAADKVRTNADQQESASSDGTGGGGSGPGGSGSGSGGSGSGGSGSGGSGDGGESGDGSGGPTVSVKGSQGGGSDNGGLGSPATEGTDSKVGFGVSHDPDSGETTYSGNGSLADWFKTTDGSKVSFGVNGGAEYTVGEKSEDGFTTYTSKSDVSIGVEGGVSKGGTGVSGGYTTGVTSEYTLKMPDGTDVDPGSVNPFDPRSMPVGSSVTMDGGSYAKTELDAAFRHIALESSVKDSEGVSSLIERTSDDTVRVTAGPTEAIANHAGLGLDFDAVKVMLGNTTSLDGASLRSAEFDLSTPEGQAAYDTYLVTGEISGDPSTGISGTTTIERVNYDSTSTVGFDTPVGGAEWQIGQNTGSLVATTYPDGSTEQLMTATYGDRGDFRLSQSFDASGTEDLSARTYSFDVTADDMSSQYFNTRDFSGFSPSGDVSPGQQVTMTLTESQMNRLADSVRTAVENDALGMQTRAIVTDYDMQPLSDPYQLATSLARAADSDLDLVMMISEINAAGDGSVTDRSAARFPGTVTLGN
ncbi:hypothetical protein NSA53_08650 [Cellulosimicrobium cellulans]|uniref:hypothetical protein n=1 Tax=Cellulosimicrobium cellulans TaxID=1710 RepID=UPI00214A57E3|nr:hypothetical protein [Cellulosimicrobium cellulans]